jgi:hypothetical protein
MKFGYKLGHDDEAPTGFDRPLQAMAHLDNEKPHAS